MLQAAHSYTEVPASAIYAKPGEGSAVICSSFGPVWPTRSVPDAGAHDEEALEVIGEAVASAGFHLGTDITLALDCAASEFYSDSLYHLEGLTTRFPIVSIEDALDESDWSGWAGLTRAMGARVQLVGDDLFVTNTQLLAAGIEKEIANSILIKFNQIGTLSETLDAIRMAQEAGYTAVISHRSGETEDTTIADAIQFRPAAQHIRYGSDPGSQGNRLMRQSGGANQSERAVPARVRYFPVQRS